LALSAYIYLHILGNGTAPVTENNELWLSSIVSYSVTGWLEKNKDPVNDSVDEIFKPTAACRENILASQPQLLKMMHEEEES
jgi:hypothetical protein